MKIIKILFGIAIFFVIGYYVISFLYEPVEPDKQEQYTYTYSSYEEIDSFGRGDGYVAYYPKDYLGESIPLIVFNHGWGAYNPLVYGAFIEHLLLQGNALIFPRYQESMFTPPENFTKNAAYAIRSGIKTIEVNSGIKISQDKILFIGHSYGGVISVNLSIQWQEFNIPRPSAVLALHPGHGPLRSGRIKDYSNFPEETKLLLISSENDIVVGDTFSREVFSLNKDKVHAINWLKMFADKHGSEKVKAVHEDPLAMDPKFDLHTESIVLFRAKMVSIIDHADIYGFWRLADALAKCAFYQEDCKEAFGDTPEQRYMGKWEDGSSVKEMKVKY